MAEITSEPSATTSATVTAESFWLKDPSDSTRNMAIDVRPPLNRVRREDVTIYRPLGRTKPVAVRGTVRGLDGTLIVLCYTTAAYDSLLTLLDSQRVLLLVDSITNSQQYIATLGEVSIQLEPAPSGSAYRTVTIEYAEVDRP